MVWERSGDDGKNKIIETGKDKDKRLMNKKANSYFISG